MGLLVVAVLFHVLVANALNSLQQQQQQQQQPSCHDEERSALLQFKDSFIIKASASFEDGAYPKVSSWKSAHDNSSSCCSWDGVECDEKTGYVIGLDLQSSCLFGSIHSNSTLFHLSHLQSLNLADNNFNYSQIPSTIRNLPSLTRLNLSASFFSGQVPPEISHLSKLKLLDLCCNVDGSSPVHDKGLLKLNGSIFRSLLHNLTSLEHLKLSCIQISWTVPAASLANHTKLQHLSLARNKFDRSLFSWVCKQTNLAHLNLRRANLNGDLSPCLQNLTQLSELWLSNNTLTGPIYSWIGNLTRLRELDLSMNDFHSSIPESIYNLINLQKLRLFTNRLAGRVEFHMFLRLQNLIELLVGQNKLEMVFVSTVLSNASFPNLKYLGLASCNINEFPPFLRYQQNLEWLRLLANKIQGQVPKWMWNTSTQTLQFIDISYNLLSGFESIPVDVLPWVNLQLLELSSNMLHGPLPIPPPTTTYYGISDNNLSGQMSSSVCNLTSLRYLDLSDNNLSGQLPQCFGNLEELRVLKLGNNSFLGTLPLTYSKRNSLMMLDVSYNKLHGPLPRSLANCVMLQFMDFTSNLFNDVFPFWLGTLPELKLLAMRHNQFYGALGRHERKILFPKLQILDLSYNNFTGEFPSEHNFPGNAMRGVTLNQSTYMKADILDGFSFGYLYSVVYSIWITNKGLERYYERIPEDFALIDLSNNKFAGEIPTFIGKLKGLRLLNMSNNLFTSSIPSSLGNLTLLESLDLSNNNLSGEIPQQLVQLTFLAKLNVSHNNLRGPVPHGAQFSTFDITSFDGNPQLCGDPLPKKCGSKSNAFQPPASSTFELDWRFVLAGVASGLVVGIVLADVAITMRQELFLKIVGILLRLINGR